MSIILNEYQTPGHSLNWKIREVIHQEQTSYQSLAILDLEDYGRALVLDGNIQVTVKDEFIYNEMLAHIPLFTHPNPSRVLVVGGGDGGVVRECLKHSTVEEVTLCEIDERVVNACKKYLPEISCDLDDPRVSIIHEDGFNIVEDKRDMYDVILVDSSDPIGPATKLFQKPFYTCIYRALKNDGLFVTQSQSPFYDQNLIRDIYKTIETIFPITRTYLSCTPTYPGGLWSFTMGSKVYDPINNEKPKERISTRYYNHNLYKSAFSLPNFIENILNS